MIGVAGAQDSVEQILAVAQGLDLGVSVVGRHYDQLDDAAAVARELDASCSVILFSGRAPYFFAASDPALRARLEYVPHEGVDLMREVARFLLDRGPIGRAPELSLDSIDRSDAEEVLVDLGVRLDGLHLIPFDITGGPGASASAGALFERHRGLYEDGVVDVCMTCLDSVSRLLRRHGVPVRRIRHARSVIRVALERCALLARMESMSGGQIGVAIVQPSGPAGGQLPAASMDQAVALFGAQIGAKVVASTAERVEMVTTRSGVETWLGQSGRASAWGGGPLGSVRLGIGFGETLSLAEQNAERALSFSVRDSVPFLVGSDGRAHQLSEGGVAYRSRITEGALLTAAQRTGLSPVSIQRVAQALQRSGSSDLTASHLGALYGVSARSARRMLQALITHGYAQPTGMEQGLGPGRPQAIYRIDLDALLAGPASKA